MRKLSVLIVEDELEIQKNFVKVLENYKGFFLVGITGSSSEARQIIAETHPSIIILDVELHNGSGNGSSVLDGLKTKHYCPFVLVTTNVTSHYTHNILRNLGADLIFSKHQIDYSEEFVIQYLFSIKDHILASDINEFDIQDNSSELAIGDKEITTLIINELNNININVKYIGYDYLIDAIKLSIDGQQQNIPKIISIKNKKTVSSVERAMQNAINRTWKKADIDDLRDYYKGNIDKDRGAPTINEFINYYARKLRSTL